MYTETFSHGMRVLLQSARIRDDVTLDPDLEAYIREGLEIKSDGSIVSVTAARFAHGSNFIDRVGYEAFANKIHIDDWSERVGAASLEEKLNHAFVLADEVGRLAARLDIPIAVIISADVAAADVVFRFHGVRPDEGPWLGAFEDLDEPVLVRVYRNASA